MVQVLTEDELARKLQNVSKNILPEVRKAMVQACHAVERRAVLNCTPGSSPYPKAPFYTGRLRNSIESKVEVQGSAVIGKVGTPVEYAIYVHDGTSKMEGRAFLLDAVVATHQDVIWILRQAIINAGLKEAGVSREDLGIYMEDLL